MDLVYLTIDEQDEETRVEKVSFVDEPAIQTQWQAFKSQKQQFKVTSEEKRVVSGPLMLAGMPIYRRDGNGAEYYVTFSKETIRKVAYKFMREGRTSMVNEDHATDVDGVFMFESYIIDSERGIKPPKGFKENLEGAWFGSFKVDNDEMWEKVKKGEVRGFSVEGIFSEEIEKQVDEQILDGLVDLMTKTAQK